jgi:dTDP-4-amino-4,6-dideoxygalactose transaminase
MFKIPYVNLTAQWQEEKLELLPIIENILASGQYIATSVVEAFEIKAAKICDTKHCIALNSGTDALVFGLAALGIRRGDEVITPPNSFVASTSAITHIGAKPVFVDVLPDQNIDPSKIEAAITKNTKAIMPVHLTGRMARMDEIKFIADKYNLQIIEDSAQAIGSKYSNIPSGKWGKVGCFSTHPLKNLNACGDGGFLVTDDDEIAEKIRLLRTHGMIDRNTVKYFGYVSRMDSIQAAILNYRIDKLHLVSEKRRKNADIYYELLDRNYVFLPDHRSQEYNTYHTFVIQVENRNAVKKGLEDLGIETSIHYPTPIHLQPASEYLGHSKGSFPVTEKQAERILTLPVNQFLSVEDITEIASKVNNLTKSSRAIRD